MKKILALSTIILYALVSKGQAITYAEDVIDFSSQFSTTSWSAQRATGAPDVYPQYGDLSNAWTSSSEDGSREYLELSFGCAHTANEVWIYETFNPGAVDTVYVQDPSSGLWEIVWSDSAVAQPKETRIFKAVFPETSFAVSEVRIAFNNPAVPGWNEIDAVAIVNSVNEELTADLSVQNIQLTPSSVAPLDTLHISGEVINLGDLCTPANQVNIYLSEDSELDFRDNEPKSIDIDALDSQGLVTFDVSMLLSGDLAIGEYYILVVVDEEERQAESNEENNLVSIPFTLNPPTPDLQIVNVALQDAIIGVEESTELSLSIQNAGTTIAGENVLRIFVSEDDNLTSLDRQVFQTSINLLSPEETVDFTVPLSFSNSEEPGLYYVFTHVDRDNNVQETDESNNIASLTLEFESDLDIQLENLAVSANVTQGADVSLTCDLKNNGSSMLTSASEVKVSFYLSEDEVLDSEELELGTIFSVPDVQLAGSFEVPATVPAGAYFVLAKADVADLIFETNEENNEISAGITISQADVDLVVSDFSIDTTEIRIGMATTLTIEIENQGSVGAPAATYKTYISDDDVLDPSDISIDDDNHPALEPNEVITDDPFLSFQGLTKTGPQYLIVSLDASQVVQESDENNDFAFPINMLPNDSDLKSDDAVLSSTTIMQGELLTVSGTIINGGSQKSSSFPFMIYLSDDDLIDQEDILLHEVSSIAGLDSAESYVFEEDLPIDRFLPVGNYNIILQIGDGSAPEVDQSNNTIVLPFGSTLSAIDLEVQNLMLPDSNVVAAGNSVSISADIVNIGSQQSVLGKYAVYLSVDNQLDLNDRRIEDDEMPGLAQNDVLGVTLDEVEIPLAVEAGTYYLFLFADADFDNPETNDNAITDLNTSNNISSIELEVSGSEVDLVVEDLIASSHQVAIGEFLEVSGSLQNLGESASMDGDMDIFLSADSIHDGGDIHLSQLEYESVGPQGDESSVFEFSTTTELPKYVAIGDYFLIVKADIGNRTPEADEGNNTAYMPIEVVDGLIDLKAFEPSLQAMQFSPNETLNFNYSFQNVGNTRSPGGFFRVLLSEDSIPDRQDEGLSSGSFSALEPGDFVSRGTQTDIDLNQSPGDYYVILEVDYRHEIPETDEVNNISLLPITIVAPDIDLTILDAGLDQATVEAGRNVRTDVVIKNIGNTYSGRSSYGFFLSADSIFDELDPLLTSRVFPELASGEERRLVASFSVQEPGEYYVFAKVDESNAIFETNESNNVASTRLTVTPGSPATNTSSLLVIEEFTAGDTTVLQGRELLVSAKIRNDGEATPSRTRMFVSLFSDPEGFDQVTSTIRIINFSNPGPGESAVSSSDITLNVKPGDYFMVASLGADRRILPVTVEATDVDLDLFHAAIQRNEFVSGEGIQLTAQIINNGTQTSRGGLSGDVMGVYLSVDDQLDSRDVALATRIRIPDLLPGESVAVNNSFSLPYGLGFGNFNLIIRVDDELFFEEENKTNNTYVVPITLLESYPDIAFEDASINRREVSGGGFIDFRGTLSNTGLSFFEDFAVTFYLSKDSLLSADDINLGKDIFWDIESGERIRFVEGLILPHDIEPVDYYALAVIDQDGTITESDEDNNLINAGVLTITSGGEVDLTIDTVTMELSTFSVVPGLLDFNARVQNLGTSRVGEANISAYLSLGNNVLDSADKPIEIFQSGEIGKAGSIGAGQRFDFRRRLFFGGDLLSGDHYILFVVDPQNEVEELDETNNISSIPITVLTPELDISAETFSLSKNQVAAGESLVGTFDLLRTGELLQVSFYIDYYLSQDTTISNDDLLLSEILYDQGFSIEGKRLRNDKLEIGLETAPGMYHVLARLDSRLELAETDESNNDLVLGTLEVSSSDIDLQVSSLTLTQTTSSPGGLLQINYDIENSGTTSLQEANITFYISADTNLDPADSLLGRSVWSFTGALAEQSLTELLIPSTYAPGEYHILAYVDEDSLVTESDESNNLGSAIVSLTAPDIDILLSDLSFGPMQAIVTQEISFRGLVSNSGSTITPDVEVSIYASTDDSFGTEDIFLTQVDLSNVGANSITRSFATDPSSIRDLPTADYFILFVVDESSQVQETDESNNVFAAVDRLEVSSGLDLKVDRLNPIADTRTGGTILISGSIANDGFVNARPTIVEIFLSVNNTLDESDFLVFQESIPGIGAGNDFEFALEVELPTSVGQGSYQVLISLDATAVEPETDESNNIVPVEGGVEILPGEDLQIVSIEEYPATSREGASVEISGILQNIGTAEAGTSNIGVYLSEDQVFDEGDLLVQTLEVGVIAPDSLFHFSLTVDIPSIQEGTYYLVIGADYQDQVSEFDESNNTFVGADSIFINPGEDLQVGGLEFPQESREGGSITIDGSIVNIGTIDASSSSFEIYLSQDQTFDGSDLVIGLDEIEALNPDSVSEFSVGVELTEVQEGIYYWIVIVDDQDQVTEFDEANNIFVSTEQMIVNPGEDLEISSLESIPSTINLDEMLNLSWLVANIGTVNTTINRLAIYLSEDQELDVDDLRVDEVEIGDLAQNASQSFETSISLVEVPVGSYYVILQVDDLNEIDEFVESNNTLISPEPFLLTEVPLSTINPLQIKVFPNPFDNYLRIESDRVYSMEIYSLQGSLVLKSNEKYLSVEHLGRGTYVVILKDQSGMIIKRDKVIKP